MPDVMQDKDARFVITPDPCVVDVPSCFVGRPNALDAMSGRAPKVVMPDEFPPVISDALTKALNGEKWQTEAIVRVLEERPELTRLFEIARGTLGNEQVQTHITLDQAAALVQRSKCTLQKYGSSPKSEVVASPV